MMNKTYIKDIVRTIRKSKKRFLALVVITMLGVTVLSGIYATCQNMYHSSDQFYDRQELFDIELIAVNGFQDKDVQTLKDIKSIDKVNGGYSEIVQSEVNHSIKKVEVSMYREGDLNTPYVMEGRLPTKEDEIMVSESYLEASNKQLNDYVDMETLAPYTGLKRLKYRIVAKVLDPRDINNKVMAFRSSASSDYTFFVGEEAMDVKAYNVIYMSVEGAKAYNCYGDTYTNKIEAVKKQIQEIPAFKDVYIQDRSVLSSYTSLQSDMGSIEAIGRVFPLLFLVVAILIGLTTMTRMVEEERLLIGTYKALGLRNRAIYMKYMGYAFLACLLGGILGDVLGFVIVPMILTTILKVLYILPEVSLGFDFLYGIGGILLFIGVMMIAVFATCHQVLKEMPATLMRPKAPKAGSRILLERIPFIWGKLKFLNKVTLRNLFRYKKRMFMSVLGVMGCTALVLIAFAIKNSVTNLMPLQYDETYRYDLMVVSDLVANDALMKEVRDDAKVKSAMHLYMENDKVVHEGVSEKVQLMVLPTKASIKPYISLRDTNGKAVDLKGKQVFLTQNAADILQVGKGDKIFLQDNELNQKEVEISDVVENYLGNHIYMSEELYESLYGTYMPNTILANMNSDAKSQIEYADTLLEKAGVLSAVSSEALKDDFSSNFTMVNTVVYVLIALAAALAFVVLFTLSNINIMERNRELATIKVLGFFDEEVSTYVNKEMMILTLIGIALGLVLGYYLSGLLTYVLKMPSLYFAVHIDFISYIIAVGISLFFAVFVNIVMNRSLKKIDMVEALKAIE